MTWDGEINVDGDIGRGVLVKGRGVVIVGNCRGVVIAGNFGVFLKVEGEEVIEKGVFGVV